MSPPKAGSIVLQMARPVRLRFGTVRFVQTLHLLWFEQDPDAIGTLQGRGLGVPGERLREG